MDVVAFWAVAMLVGALALPIAFAVFRRMPDGGAGLAFAFGLVLSSAAYFLLRTVSALEAGRAGPLAVIALLALVSCAVAGRDRRFQSTFRRSGPALIATAGLFSLLFFAFAAFRSYTPEISGTEQPMDLMYLNAALTSPDYPPHDPWLAGETASYYYFGYVQVAVLTSASGVPASVGYNLGLAYTFASAGVAISSLAYALVRRTLGAKGRNWAIFGGGLAVTLLLFVGSLAAIFEWSAAHGHANRALYEDVDMEWRISCQLDDREYCYEGAPGDRTDAWYPSEFFFWFSLTRIIPGTIDEFPLFSFILGDLHPHVTAIPLVLLVVGLALAAWQGRSRLSFATHRKRPAYCLLVAVLLGALAFQNAWDVITFSALFGVAVLARNLRASPGREALVGTAGFVGPPALLALLLYSPWLVDFSSQAEGVVPYTGAGTLPTHAVLHFGPVAVAALALLAWAGRGTSWRKLGDIATVAVWAPLLPFLAWLVFAALRGDLQDGVEQRAAGGWVTLAGFALAAWLLATATGALALRRPGVAPAAALATVGFVLLYGAELFYVGDIFDSIPRLNTVFKLSYQAWILLSLAGAVGLTVALHRALRGHDPAAWLAMPALLLAAGGLVFALIAIPNRTEGFDRETEIDGLAFLARTDPGEYALIRWMERNVPRDAVVLEASGRGWRVTAEGQPELVSSGSDYSESGRIAARSGRQTPIGWYFHEVQWRGQGSANAAEFSGRQEAVDAAYLAPDATTLLDGLRELGASYAVVGTLERSRYPDALLAPFDEALDLAFEAGDVRLYALPVRRLVRTS